MVTESAEEVPNRTEMFPGPIWRKMLFLTSRRGYPVQKAALRLAKDESSKFDMRAFPLRLKYSREKVEIGHYKFLVSSLQVRVLGHTY
ncbi:hypothetical protein PoB_006873400 [Plakobranchus ocellatus]|uniref:Uncharacterized protein n=1 Tax=Plakobranchus ocellatus TaxID=259542 RepID=A0AAV4DDE9_9GAST|nr:hypothetical protein PoB_006873400 [Plakobranchus ocellatus]